MKHTQESLTVIPGVGKQVAEDLRRIGIKRPSCLKGKDPEKLYLKLEKLEGKHARTLDAHKRSTKRLAQGESGAHQVCGHVDRCMLYVMRCAVYFAEGGREDAQLKWWNWKDVHGDKHECGKVA